VEGDAITAVSIMGVDGFVTKLGLDEVQQGGFAGGAGDEEDAGVPTREFDLGPEFEVGGEEEV